MPRPPSFRFPFSLPFDLSWIPEGALWALDLPSEMSGVRIPAHLEDEYATGRRRFFFGPAKLKPVSVALQAYLDEFQAEKKHPENGILDHEISSLGSANAITGPHAEYLASRHGLEVKFSRQGFRRDTIGGLTQEELGASIETLKLIRDNPRPNAPLPDGFYEARHSIGNAPGHGWVASQIMGQVAAIPQLADDKEFSFARPGGLLMPFWRYDDFAHIVRDVSRQQARRVNELYKELVTLGMPEGVEPSWVATSRFSIDLTLPEGLADALQNTKMRRHGFSPDHAPPRQRHALQPGKPRTYSYIPAREAKSGTMIEDVRDALVYVVRRNSLS